MPGDQWEEEAAKFKNAPPIAGPSAPSGGDDWKLWSGDGAKSPAQGTAAKIPEHTGSLWDRFKARGDDPNMGTPEPSMEPGLPGHPGEDVKAGMQQIGQGQYAAGAHNIASGVGKASSVLLPAAIAAAPATTAASLITGGITGAIGKVGSRALGASEDQSDVIGDVAGVVGGGYTGGKIGGAADAALARAFGDPVDMMARAANPMVSAVKPRASVLNFKKNLVYSGMGDAKAGESVLGRPVESLQDALQAIKHAKAANRKAYEPFGGPNRGEIPVDLSAAAQAMESSIPATLLHEAQKGVPSAVNELRNRQAQSAAYKTVVPLSKAEAMLKDANAELDAFYAKYPRAQWSSLQTNPETAAVFAKAKTLRDSVYSALDNYGEGDAPRDINKRYGNLIELEGELQRRQNVADRQQPLSLSEQFNKAQAIGHGVMGVGKMITGNPSGAMDVAGAMAQKAASKWIKEQQTTDALIKRAFANYKDSPKEFGEYQPPNVKGLLTSGPLVTPPPADTSGPIYNPRNNPMQPSPRLQLPAATSKVGVSGVIVPDILGRSTRGSGSPVRLLPAPKPGEPPVNFLPSNYEEIMGKSPRSWANVPGDTTAQESEVTMPRGKNVINKQKMSPDNIATRIGKKIAASQTDQPQ